MENNEYGLIYILTNPYFKGLVKIGATRSLDINKRMRVLGIAVLAPFKCPFAYKVSNKELFKIEHILHENYKDKRIKGSEFFKVEANTVDKLMRNIGRFEPMQSAVQEAINNEEIKKVRRKNMDFFELGLYPGDVLIYTRDKNITCTIASNKLVDYKDERAVSLSRVTKRLLGYAVQPSLFWQTKENVKLIDLQNNKTS